jgi:acid phosphatase
VPTSASTAGPAVQLVCGERPAPPATYAHVVWIVMENHSYGSVIGSRPAPYQTQLARQCASVLRWATVGSPSLPNYLGLTGGETFGVHDDGNPAAHPVVADNLFRQVRQLGKTERSFEEDMSHPCALSSAGVYAVKHNPLPITRIQPTGRRASPMMCRWAR